MLGATHTHNKNTYTYTYTHTRRHTDVSVWIKENANQILYIRWICEMIRIDFITHFARNLLARCSLFLYVRRFHYAWYLYDDVKVLSECDEVKRCAIQPLQHVRKPMKYLA